MGSQADKEGGKEAAVLNVIPLVRWLWRYGKRLRRPRRPKEAKKP